MTDALTKYVELVPLPNKEADTVANAIFDKWYCRFGAPLDIVTDQGKEFCAKLSNELFKRLGTNHFTTSPHHPQCNSQAEVANKTIAKYLASFCDDSTLNWELYLAPLMFSYNTSFHQSVKTTPFYLTFGMEPRLQDLPTPDLCWKFYGESSTDDIICKLLIARNVARQNNEDASDAARVQYDSKAVPHKFLPQQLVLLDEHSFLHKNQKLAPKWSGPHKIIRLKGDANAEILLRHNNRKTVDHTNRLKPILSLSPILRSTRMISLLRRNRLTNPCSRLPINRLMMTFTPGKTIYCLHSWRLTIRYLPLRLLNQRCKFLLAAALASHPAHLQSHHLCYSTKRLPLCSLTRAHTPKYPHMLLPPNSAILCHRLHSSRCLYLKGGRGLIMITHLMRTLQLIMSTRTILGR
jgi:hypothetical protein